MNTACKGQTATPEAMRVPCRIHILLGLASLIILLQAAILALGLWAQPAAAAGDANVARACPNERLTGFSPNLPDCRGYEPVTPAYKQANEGLPFAIAEDGSRVLISSIGAFSGDEVGPEPRRNVGVLYELTRGEGGWSTTPVSPPNPDFRGAASWNVPSADLTRTLFDMPAAPAGQESYFVREPDGTLSEVGPINPPADGPVQGPGPEGPVKYEYDRFVGASRDLSHILFTVTHNLGWSDPSDELAFDLYEYVGRNQSEPTKVAVSNEAGHPLLSLCGADLGGPPNSSAYNAISDDGSMVFFTPLTRSAIKKGAEGCAGSPGPDVLSLYARIAGSETVPISTPELTQAECSARHESASGCEEPKADSVFSGASSNGGKVYFLSTEKLAPNGVEDRTPGDSAFKQQENESAEIKAQSGCEEAAGSGCNLYEYNFSKLPGQRLAVVTEGSASPHVQGVVRISQDGSHVYFVAQGKLSALPNARGEEAAAGANNLYVYESSASGGDAKTRFIAELAPSEEAGGHQVSIDSRLWGGAIGADVERPAETSTDGAHLVFQSHADLTADDTSTGFWQAFEYEADLGSLARISIGDEGFNNDGNTSEYDASLGAPPAYPSAGSTGGSAPSPPFSAVSSDGAYVFFQTGAILTPGAGSFSPAIYNKIYEYHLGRTYLIYAGDTASTRLLGTDASGADVFFETNEAVLPGFAPAQQDIYDARVGGGVPLRLGVGCSGEACLGPATEAPELPTPGSISTLPGGNFVSTAPVHSHSVSAAKLRKSELKAALAHCRRKHLISRRRRCESMAHKRYRAAVKRSRRRKRHGK